MTTTLGATTYDWVKLGTDTATEITKVLVNKGNSSSNNSQQLVPTTNYNSQQTGYPQPQSNDNILLYIGAAVVGVALIYALMSNNNKKR